jgi:septal ring factor EnvC (AmiA/AmiB activator)
LQRERDAVTEKIQELREELALLDDHLAGQMSKHDEVDGQIQASSGALGMLRSTLADIEMQIEKAELLRSNAQR